MSCGPGQFKPTGAFPARESGDMVAGVPVGAGEVGISEAR
jgi:hypothetical protein